MRIILYPTEGLANRMRSINAAFHFSQDCGARLNIFWVKDKGLNCDYTQLFRSHKFIHDSKGLFLKCLFFFYQRMPSTRMVFRVLEKWGLLKVFSQQDIESLLKYTAQKRIEHCLVVIRSCSNFYRSGTFKPELFVLQPQIEELIKSEVEKFADNTIGVHIRRADNVKSISYSPLILFEKRMNSKLEACPDTKFYLTTDDQEVKSYFKQHDKWKDKVIMPQGVISRNSVAGIIQAVVEMFTLSRTKLIIGSYWSSFSEMASMIGRIKLEVARIEK